MRSVGGGVVAASVEGTDRQSCAFAGICVLPGGRWMCGFRAAPTKGSTRETALLTWSDDEGKTWSDPREIVQPPVVEGKPGRFRCAYLTPLGGHKVMAIFCWIDDTDPSLPFFNTETEGLLETRPCLAVSEDAGETWSEPWFFDTSPYPIPATITGPVMRLASGELACQFELNKTYYDTSVWRHSSITMVSNDGGRTWPAHSVSSNDPTNRVFYWDQRSSALPDGRILDLFWTYDNVDAVYLNIHGRESLDNGRSWGDMWDTGVPGQPSQPVYLPGGDVAMAYVDRTGPTEIKVCASKDFGRTWDRESEVTIYSLKSQSQTWKKGVMQDAWAEMGQFSAGLPAATSCPNGDMLVVYYAGPDTDHTDIRWARLRKSNTGISSNLV